MRLKVSPLEFKTSNKQQTNSSESNHNLKATLAFIRPDLFIGAWWWWCGGGGVVQDR